MDIPFDLIKKYDLPVPRYTSYPTAVQFQPVTPESTAQARTQKLAALNAQTPVSIYIHIPFCDQLCLYCGCHTKVVNRYDPVASYVDTLIQEIVTTGHILDAQVPVSLIHFGGGSPNSLSPDDMKRIIHTIENVFHRTEETQLSLELDPRTLSETMIDTFGNLAVTRVSLGVQDFDPDVQKAIQRIQPFDLVKEKTEKLRASGISAINFDMMIGLPLQTQDIIRANMEKAITLAPDRMAVFAYAHVPWMKKQQTLLEQYPRADGPERFAMMANTAEQLTQAGYHAIGIDHFAKENDSLYQAFKNKTLRRNFQGYTDDQSTVLLGFGLSAISSFDDLYLQNHTDAPLYKKAVTEGIAPLSRFCTLHAQDTRNRAQIEKIMCYGTAEAQEIPNPDFLQSLIADGLATYDGKTLRVTQQGHAFTRLVAACFDTYWDAGKSRHAKAI